MLGFRLNVGICNVPTDVRLLTFDNFVSVHDFFFFFFFLPVWVTAHASWKRTLYIPNYIRIPFQMFRRSRHFPASCLNGYTAASCWCLYYRSHRTVFRNQQTSSTGKAFDLYSGDARFEFQTEHWLYWLKVIVIIRIPPDKHRDSNLVRPWQFPSTYFAVHYSMSSVHWICVTESVSKYITNKCLAGRSLHIPALTER
jgi:hypothetical protein